MTFDYAQVFFKPDKKDNSRKFLTGARSSRVRQVVVGKGSSARDETYLGPGRCRLPLVPISELVELSKP